MAPMGWYPDPVGRHQYRYWDGASWTPHVANNGETSVEPLNSAPDKDGGAEPVAARDAVLDHDESTVSSITEAKERLGEKNVFGPHEWLRHFPELTGFSDDQLAESSEIPWPKSLLSQRATLAEGGMGAHFLFLGLKHIDFAGRQQDLNLYRWFEICHPGISNVVTFGLDESVSKVRWPDGPKFSNPRAQLHEYREDSNSPRDAFTRGVVHWTVLTCEFRWYFVPADVLNSSIGVSNVARPAEYDIATAVETVTANILHHLLNGKYLSMASQIARTSDFSLSRYGQDVCVWSDRDGLSVGPVTRALAPGVVLSRSPHV